MTDTETLPPDDEALLQLIHNLDINEEKKSLKDLTLEGLATFWKENNIKNVITMVGAGMSTAAGIPDFRSPSTGLYDNLQKYNLPHPTAIFEMTYFRKNPKPFFTLAKELYPGCFEPTTAHYFVRLLHEKGLLLRHYTQNIDTLERLVGLPDEKLVEAHGSFYTGHCLKCRKKYTLEWMKKLIFEDEIPKCEKCKGVVKPDIVFFGENLPDSFQTLPGEDFKKCDLLIIMGTSLEVRPFCELVFEVGPKCPRLLINLDSVGRNVGLKYGKKDNVRDIAYLGTCDDGVVALAKAMNWELELDDLMKKCENKVEKKDLKKKEENELKEKV